MYGWVLMVVLLSLTGCLAVNVNEQGGAEPATKSRAARQSADSGGVLTGRCLCGGVAYRVDGPILEHNACRCESCRFATGALETPWAVVAEDGFTITRGRVERARNPELQGCCEHGAYAFCPDCGSTLFWFRADGGKVDIAVGTLDDPSRYRPKPSA